MWHVRHSALFALPALLPRLPFPRRREIAIETVTALSTDSHPTVRSGVLEAIGEVIYTFHDDPAGPPEELLSLFLGRRTDVWVRTGQENPSGYVLNSTSAVESFYTDSRRPLICAFNFPAVVLTLGSSRWAELRETYRDLTLNPNCGVQRTLVASLGEVAKIIGKDQSLRDLVQYWRNSLRSEDEETRLKAIESVKDLCNVVGLPATEDLLSDLCTAWDEGVFRTWRERATMQQHLLAWSELAHVRDPELPIRLVFKGLEDNVAAVREAAISAVRSRPLS